MFALGIIVGLSIAFCLTFTAYLVGFRNGVDAQERADRERRQRGGGSGANQATP